MLGLQIWLAGYLTLKSAFFIFHYQFVKQLETKNSIKFSSLQKPRMNFGKEKLHIFPFPDKPVY